MWIGSQKCCIIVELGNSVIVVEHNLDLIKNADYIIDMGPEGGDRGGEVRSQQAMSQALSKLRQNHAATRQNF